MADIRVYDATGKVSDLLLDFDIEKRETSSKTYSCAIRALLQNWRQGTVGCKTRKDLAFSNRKPWKQKGTGRARAGSLRSPLWRKGAVLFGPQPRERMLDLNKKQVRLVFNNLYFEVLQSKSLVGLDFAINSKKPSTKEASHVLAQAGLKDKKVILFLSFHDTFNFASFRNIENVRILFFDQPNAFDLSNSDYWIFLKKDLDLLKEMVLRWN
jgi:large subunit ribosomal protein L4